MNNSGSKSRDPRKRLMHRSSSPQGKKNDTKSDTPKKNNTPNKKKQNSNNKAKRAKEKEREKNESRIQEMNSLLNEDDQSKKSQKEETKSDIVPETTKTAKRNYSQLNDKKDFLKFEDTKEDENNKDDEIEALDKTFKKLKGGKQKNEDSGKGDINQGRYEEEKKEAVWLTKQTFKIKNTLVRFHNEIIDFMNYVSPTKEEHQRREKAFERLAETILQVFPTAKVLPFGSFATKMYLPHADIDLVVLEPNANPNTLMNKLAKVLLKNDNYEAINVIRSAKVPLIKLVESSTGYNFDISFNKLDGVKQIKEIRKALSYYPEMKYLTVLMKCFLKQRDLNETYTGGVGSFLLFCLILTFLREIRREYIEQDREEDIPKILLSEYVLKFMEYYANFDIANHQIIVAEGGAIVEKYVKDHQFSVISPQEATHDIGGAAFKVKEVFGVFKNRFHFLTNYNFKEGESILKYLVNADCL